MNEAAMQERNSILRHAGHVVSQAKDVRQVESACSGIQFDVVIIGHSLPAQEKVRVADIVRRCCRAKIVELHDREAGELQVADAQVAATDIGRSLLNTVERLTSKRRSA